MTNIDLAILKLLNMTDEEKFEVLLKGVSKETKKELCGDNDDVSFEMWAFEPIIADNVLDNVRKGIRETLLVLAQRFSKDKEINTFIDYHINWGANCTEYHYYLQNGKQMKVRLSMELPDETEKEVKDLFEKETKGMGNDTKA